MIALIDTYRKELLEIATFTEETVQNYTSCLVLYCDYAKNTLGIDPSFSKGCHLLKWLTKVRETDISNSRVQHHMSALKLFFALLCKLGIRRKNPADALPQIRKIYGKRNIPVPAKTVHKLLRSIDVSNWHGKRNYVMIAVLWALGLRISELTSLKVKSFEPDHAHRIGLLRIRGKNRKQRALFVVDQLYDCLTDYLKEADSPWKKNAPLFPIQSGKAISNDQVRKLIKGYCLASNIKERITPHVLRHTFATEMYHQGVPLKAIQAMMGHEHKAETSVYIHVSDNLKRQALDQLIPEGGLFWA